MATRKSPLFRGDDFPNPFIIYRQTDGKLVEYNQEARQIFELPLKPGNISISKLRPAKLPKIKTTNPEAFTNFGYVRHFTKKKKLIVLGVKQKKIKRDGIACLLEFFDEIDGVCSIKNEIIQTSIDAFMCLDESQQIVDWNYAAEKIFGWKKEEVIGSLWVDTIVPNHDRKQHLKWITLNLETSKANSQNKHIEISGIHKNGKEFPIELAIRTVRENGRALYFFFIRDIAEKKIYEERIFKSELYLRRAQSIASIGSWEMYGNYTDIHWSDEFYRIHGLAPQSIKPSAKLRLSMVHGQDRNKLQKAIEEAARFGKPYSLEKRIIQPNGELRWVLSQGEASLDIATGKRRVFGTLLDITNRKLSELKENKIKNRLSETLYFGRIGTVALTIETGILKIYPEMLSLLEEESSSSKSLHVNDFIKKYVLDEDREPVFAKLNEGLNIGRLEVKEVYVQFRIKTAKGNILYIDAQGTFRKDGTALGILRDITVRDKAQREAQLRGLQIEGMLNGVTDGIFAMDHKLNLTLVNPTFANQLKLRPEQIVGRNVAEFFSTIEWGQLLKAFKKAIQSQKPFQLVHRGFADPNQVFEINLYPNAQGLFVYYKNISIQKKLEVEQIANLKKIKDTKDDLRAMLDASVDSTIFLDTKGCVRVINKKGEEWVRRFYKGNIIGEVFADLLPDNFMKEYLTHFRRALNSELVDFEYESQLPEGVSWIRAKYIPVYNERDQIIGVSQNVTDITQLKLAVEEIFNSQRLLKTLADNNPMPVFMKGINGHLIFNNNAFQEKIIKQTAKHVSDFDIYPKDKVQFYRDQEKMIIQTGETVTFEYELEDRHYFATKFPIRNNQNKIYAIGGITMDITDRKKAEAEVLLSKADLLTVFSHTDAGYILFDRDLNIKSFNKNGEIFTYDVHQKHLEIGYPFLSYFDKIRQELVSKTVSEVLAGKTIEFDRQVPIHSGLSKWFHVKYSPVLDVENQVIGMLMSLVDITQRILVEQEIKEGNERLHLLSENIPNGALYQVALRNGKRSFLFISGGIEAITGVAAREIVEDSSNLYGLLHPDDRLLFREEDHSIFETRQEYDEELRLINKNGEVRWIHARSHPREVNGEVVLDGFLIDITDRKKTEMALRESEERLRYIIESEPNCVKVLNQEGRLVEMNSSGLKMIEASDLDSVMGKRITEIVDPPYRRAFKALTETVINGASGNLEFSITGLKGTKRWLKTHAVPMKDPKSNNNLLLGLTRDITEEKQAKEQLLLVKNRLELATQAAGLGIWEVNFETNKISWDEGMLKIYGTGPNSHSLTKAEWTTFIHPEDLPKIEEEDKQIIQSDTNSYKSSFRIIRRDNGEVRYIDNLGIIKRDVTGKAKMIIGVNMDRTTERVYEKQLIGALKEKEILIKEIHHRVKNNLQLISSVIYIRAAKTERGDVKDFLEETRKKIKAIALIHERLLQTNLLDQVNTEDYLGKLITDLQMTIPDEKNIQILAKIESMMVNLDHAIYCGLIVNELVTNAIKHAFVNELQGTIIINFSALGNKRQLTVSNTGTPLAENIELGHPYSFGFQMLDIFIKQLKGELAIMRNNGTTFTISF